MEYKHIAYNPHVSSTDYILQEVGKLNEGWLLLKVVPVTEYEWVMVLERAKKVKK